MSDLEEFEGENLPVSYCLEEAMSCPEYRDAMPLERLLSRYFFMRGDVRLGSLVSDVIRRHFTPPERFQRGLLDDVTCLVQFHLIGSQCHLVVVTDFQFRRLTC